MRDEVWRRELYLRKKSFPVRHEVVAVMRERPLGAGFKEQAPKHLKLLCPKGMVVSVEEKAGFNPLAKL